MKLPKFIKKWLGIKSPSEELQKAAKLWWYGK